MDKLLKVGFVREVYYPEWLANVVLIKKANEKWCACINYTNLNKTCPKDSYPLPCIDQLVDVTSKHQLLSFMDVFSRYNQIHMASEDEEKHPFLLTKIFFATGLYHSTWKMYVRSNNSLLTSFSRSRLVEISRCHKWYACQEQCHQTSHHRSLGDILYIAAFSSEA